MSSETNKPAEPPVLELWRILALALIVAAGMLFVHLIAPSEADVGAGPIEATVRAR